MEDDSPAPEPGLPPAEALRLLLILLLWVLWLALRALWSLVRWLVSLDWRTWTLRGTLLLALGAAIFLGPKAAGLYWSRMLLRDAVEIAAMQSDGKALPDIDRALRRKAYALGFTDVVGQDEAFRIERQEEQGGTTCTIEVDFVHRLDLYRWAAPEVRIHFRVEQPVIPKPPEATLEELLGLTPRQ